MSNKPDLKELVKIWYAKLKESGFKDAERFLNDHCEPVLHYWDSTYFSTSGAVRPEEFEARQEYFYKATQFLNTYQFKSQTDHHIWRLHSEGMGLRGISKDLAESGVKLNKDSVARVIKRLQVKMRLAEAICESEN